MNKETIKAFIAWLESATIEEMRNRQTFITKHLADIRTPEGRSDARLALRLIDEELLARMELQGPAPNEPSSAAGQGT